MGEKSVDYPVALAESLNQRILKNSLLSIYQLSLTATGRKRILLSPTQCRN